MLVGGKKDAHFAEMIEIAMRLGKPVRIGVNWGSLDQELLQNVWMIMLHFIIQTQTLS